jgi:hypothetical protein
MFDTPDLMPLCLAPFIAVFIGVLVLAGGFVFGRYVEKEVGKQAKWWRVLVIILTIVIIPITCFVSVNLEIGARDSAPWFKPATRNIAGKWILAPDPTDNLPRPENLPNPARRLVFYKDGTFVAIEIPDMWSYTDMSELNHVEYFSGSGTWYLGQVEGTQRMEWVIFTEFLEIDGKEDSRTMRFYFEGHLPPYTLATLDSGYRRFHFERP